jgi:hypothetical protein
MNANHMAKVERPATSGIKVIHELTLSLCIGLTSTVALFWTVPTPFVSALYRMDSSIRDSLDIRQTDVATTHFVFFILGVSVALCAWAFLRGLETDATAETILQRFAGYWALAALPAAWFVNHRPWLNGWYLWQIVLLLELLSIIYFATRYWRGKRPTSVVVATMIVAFHFVIWSGELGPYAAVQWMFRFRQLPAYLLFVPVGSPIAWTVAFCSAVVWVFYVDRSRRTPITSYTAPRCGGLGLGLHPSQSA